MVTMDAPQLPDLVRAKAEAGGDAGRDWLAGLGDLLADCARRWSLTIGEPIDGGTSSYVVRVRDSAGRDAVLKLAVPDFWAPHEIRRITGADGVGYVRALDAEPARGAILMESLGPSLSGLGLSPAHHIDVLCRTLRRAWDGAAPETAPAQTGRSKAEALNELIERAWAGLDRPCPAEVVDTARRFAHRRADAFDADRCVPAHGDPHAGNAMRVRAPRPGAESGFVFVDPEPFLAEPGYDLGVTLRGLLYDFPDAVSASTVRDWCGSLAKHCGADPDAVWEWGFLETVSTGLYVLELGASWGAELLDVAQRIR